MKKIQMVAAAVTLLAVQSTFAITVNWGAPTAINSNDDIINPGGVIRAVNFGNDSAIIPVVADGNVLNFDSTGISQSRGFTNGAFFVDDNPAPGVVSGTTVDASNNDPGSEFHRVLDSFSDNGAASVTFSGLNAGETYFVQGFHSDDRGNRTNKWNIDGVEIEFTSGNAFFQSTFVIAEVILDGGETSFTFTRTQSQINAVVLSQVPPVVIPEPATATLALFGLAGLARRRRRAC